MYNRKRLDRERLEIYLAHLLFRSRRLFLFGGMLLLVYAMLTLLASPVAGSSVALFAALALALGSSHQAVLLAAKIGAWIATLGRRNGNA
jgi:hypothetical protein